MTQPSSQNVQQRSLSHGPVVVHPLGGGGGVARRPAVRLLLLLRRRRQRLARLRELRRLGRVRRRRWRRRDRLGGLAARDDVRGRGDGRPAEEGRAHRRPANCTQCSNGLTNVCGLPSDTATT